MRYVQSRNPVLFTFVDFSQSLAYYQMKRRKKGGREREREGRRKERREERKESRQERGKEAKREAPKKAPVKTILVVLFLFNPRHSA